MRMDTQTYFSNNTSNKYKVIYYASFTVLGFLFHLIWEYLQCAPFFKHYKTEANTISMIRATIGDIFFMWVILAATYIVNKLKVRANKTFNEMLFLSPFLLSILIAIAIECWGLKTGRWGYTKINLLIPGLGISIFPVLQMPLIFFFSLFLSEKLSSRIYKIN